MGYKPREDPDNMEEVKEEKHSISQCAERSDTEKTISQDEISVGAMKGCSPSPLDPDQIFKKVRFQITNPIKDQTPIE